VSRGAADFDRSLGNAAADGIFGNNFSPVHPIILSVWYSFRVARKVSRSGHAAGSTVGHGQVWRNSDMAWSLPLARPCVGL